uniref:Glutamine amidotransferase domain-containing protein n=1 Tax=Ananas comosus var. bracteatus TaxID=296719 RepID=A0A6V7P8J6_ANACO|nr:unnamed protein product [Ananas comosus var. bracteatus]
MSGGRGGGGGGCCSGGCGGGGGGGGTRCWCGGGGPEHVWRMHGGYFGVFAKLLGDHNNGDDDDGEEEEVWVAYRAARGELPQEKEEGFEGYDGFMVTGSCNDAHGDDPWIHDLVRFLQKLFARRKKVLGICFGHQRKPRCPISDASARATMIAIKIASSRDTTRAAVTWEQLSCSSTPAAAYDS